MALTNEYPVISSNLKIGNGLYATCDPFNSGLLNNGAQNPLGSLYCMPSPSQGSIGLPSAAGYGSFLWVKYVKYLSTGNPATVGGPAPVYYTDETLTVVSGVSTESVGGVNMVAGWLLPNTSTGATGAGAGFTNTVLNGGGNGSYVFIGLLGFIPGCVAAAGTAAGDAIIGLATNFAVNHIASGTAPTNKVLGWAMSAVSGGLCDVMAYVSPF